MKSLSLQLASAPRDVHLEHMDVQVDVAGGGTVTYVDDTLFPIAKVVLLKIAQRRHCVPNLQAAAVESKVHCQATADFSSCSIIPCIG